MDLYLSPAVSPSFAIILQVLPPLHLLLFRRAMMARAWERKTFVLGL